MKKILLMFLVSLLASVFPQDENSLGSEITINISVGGPNTSATGVNCFDYYHFGSVIFAFPHTEKAVYKPGERVRVITTIVNSNPYPIVHGNVIAQVFLENNNSGNLQGDYMLDEFSAFEDLSLDANQSYELAVEWQIPENAPSGKYYIALFFQEMHNYNLAGLPFLSNVFGGVASFEVKGIGEKQPFYIDRNGITLNGKHVILRQFSKTFKQGEKIEYSIPVVNLSNEKLTVFIEKNLYSWDQSDESNLMKNYSSGEVLELAPGEIGHIKLSYANLAPGAYEAEVKAYANGWQNILLLRFGVDGAKGRFVFSGLTKFPLVKGDKATMFACFSNTTGWFSDFNGNVELRLYDKNGNLVGSESYKGVITPKIIAIKKEFEAKEDYDWLKLVAIISDLQGKVHQKVEKVYDLASFRNKEIKERFEEAKSKPTPPEITTSETPELPVTTEQPSTTPPVVETTSKVTPTVTKTTPKKEGMDYTLIAGIAVLIILIGVGVYGYLKKKG